MSSSFPATVVRTLLSLFLLVSSILSAAAQAPGWQSAQAVAMATASGSYTLSGVSATAVDAVGNVFVTGTFRNSTVLGSTTLTSLGGLDVFIAKFNPISNQFVWAQRAGGLNDDISTALAVSGTSLYVAGTFSSLTADFGATTLSNTNSGLPYAFVAKLTDAGSMGSFVWAQQAGGSVSYANALAVSGTSVYVAGTFSDPTADFGNVILSNSSSGSYDAFVAKITDTGSMGNFVWAQQASGLSSEEATALAVSGTSVYVAGTFTSLTADFGATTLSNANSNSSSSSRSPDVFVAKLTDAGSTGSFVWAKQAGGSDYERTSALVVNGTSVYVAGAFQSSTATFGSTILSNVGSSSNSPDAFVAKLADAGNTASFVWVEGVSGSGNEQTTALSVSGNSVYVAGFFLGPTATFGAITLSNINSPYSDAFVAKLTDAGSFVWAQRAGGSDNDRATALAMSGTSVYVAGYFSSSTVAFGTTTLTSPVPGASLGFLATLTDPTLMGIADAQRQSSVQLFPNPARHVATLRLPAGAAPAPLALTDAQGRTVRHYPAPTAREVTLDLRGLPAGLYLLRGAGPLQRLVVE